jgi:hyaluronate lyase
MLVWIVLVAICVCGIARGEDDPFDVLRARRRDYLISGDGTPIGMGFRPGPADLATRALWAWKSMNRDPARASLWGDRAAGATASSSWITQNFVELQTMALAWATPGCSLHGDAGLAAAVDEGLDWMVDHAFTPTAREYDNWWDWEIGGPQAFNNAVVLMYPTLTSGQIGRYCLANDGHSPGGPANTYGWQWSTGTIDLGFVMIVRGILGKDAERMTTAKAHIATIFPDVTTGNGFYADGSFVLHNNKAYTGAYGVILLNAVADLMSLLEGSPWQTAPAEKACVFKWVRTAFEPVIYNGAMMDMVRGRTISRPSETEATMGTRALFAIRQIARCAPPPEAAALLRFAEAPRLPSGQFPFAGMDRVVALRDGFGVGVSMASARIAGYESIHGEDIHGWFTGDGMTYLYVGAKDTQFVGDYWPTVDPYHLPGTTVEIVRRADAEGAGKTGSENWVGGAEVSGAYGTAGMSLGNPLEPSLLGRKSWFMFDREMVCLGAGISCSDPAEVDTTVEDRRLGRDAACTFTIDGARTEAVIEWSRALGKVSWCALDGVGGYYFPGGADGLQAALESRKGAWSDIGASRGPVSAAFTESYLKLWFNHGPSPAHASYAYVLLPNRSAEEVGLYAARPEVVVLANTPMVQAAANASLGVVAANFWTAGTQSAGGITVNAPSSVITRREASVFSIGISDPTQANAGTIAVQLHQAASALIHADPGVTVVQLSPAIVLEVNVAQSVGRSFHASFSLGSPVR